MPRSQCDCGRFIKESSVKWTIHKFEGVVYDIYEWHCSFCGYERRMHPREQA